jgi:hypothetical protein
MTRAHRHLIIAVTVSLLSASAALSGAPALAQEAGDSFVIGYGDTVADGVPEPGAGNIEAGGAVDSYSFEAEAGDVAILDVLEGRAGDFRWRLEAPGGTALFDGLYVDRSAELLETGTYTLSVRGSTATTVGTYSFRLLLTPPAEEFTIGFGDKVSDGVPEPGAGDLEGPGAVDRYLFEGTAGQVAILDALTGSTNEVRWSLHAPDGAEIFDAFYVDQEVTLPQAGTYTLTVSGLSITRFGVYSFQLLDVPPPIDQFPIGFGDTVSDGVPEPGAGNLEGPGAADRYLFDGTADQVAILDALTGSTNEVRWSLHAPDGAEIFDAFYVDQEVTLPQTGTYTLTVSGQSITSFGVYSFELREAPANTDPVAVDDVAETDHGVPVTIDVLANDTDPDGDDLVVDAVTQPADGTAAIDGNQITYTPDTGFAGTDSFTYTVADGRGGSDEATITVTVHEPPNTPPTITDIDDQDNTVGDHVTLQVDADDPDGDDLTYAAGGLPPGIDIDPATGEITGTIDLGAEVDSPYTVDITVTDPDGATATTSFQWTVNPANTDPVTVDVDILPRCIVNDGHGVVPVVIFGNDSVAADQIDPATVELEGMPVQRFFGWFMAFVHDVDGDGFDDLFVLIDDVADAIPAEATTASVTGLLYDGTTVEGADDICLLRRLGVGRAVERLPANPMDDVEQMAELLFRERVPGATKPSTPSQPKPY